MKGFNTHLRFVFAPTIDDDGPNETFRTKSHHLTIVIGNLFTHEKIPVIHAIIAYQNQICYQMTRPGQVGQSFTEMTLSRNAFGFTDVDFRKRFLTHATELVVRQ